MAGETYAYQVKAIRGEDRSQASGQARVQLPHDPVDLAPSNLTALILTRVVVGEEDSTTSVDLSWSAPAEDADSVTGYEVLRAVGQGEFTTLAADTGSTATTYTDATATEAGETYAYQVKAIRGEDRSQASGQAQVQIPHDPVDLAPSNLTAALAEGKRGGAELERSGGGRRQRHRLRGPARRGRGGADHPGGATPGPRPRPTPTPRPPRRGETYAYQVKAIRGEDRSQASGQAQVQVPHDPVDLAPSNLTAFILTAVVVGEEDTTSVYLIWTAPAEDADSVTGYEVLRAVGEGDLAILVVRHRVHGHDLHRRHGHRDGGDLRLPGEGHPGRRPQPGIGPGPGPTPP